MTKFTTKEIDPLTFQAGIWMTEANLVSPVIVEAEEQYFQPLSQFFKEIEKTRGIFLGYGLVGGIAQYSVENQSAVGLLFRQDMHFRHTTQDEREHDVEWFGEQVAPYPLDDEEVTSKMREDHPCTVELFGKPWIYTGPERLISDNYTCRVFPGTEPDNIAELVKEIDGAVIPKDQSAFQRYILFVSDKGVLRQVAFGKPEEYSPAESSDFGVVEIRNDQLMFYPGGNRQEARDFSEVMHQGDHCLRARLALRPAEEGLEEKTDSALKGMKHLFIVRHGDYGRDDHLNETGKKQMQRVGAAIREIVGDSAYILSSTAPRGIDSAEVLAVQLGLPKDFETTEDLWTARDSPKEKKFYCDSELLLRMIDERRDRADGLILVSHLEICGELPGAFYQKEFGKDKYLGSINKGQAYHIDLQTQEHRII